MPHHIVFLGTPEFAVASLRALAKDSAFSVDLVVTQPDRHVGRKQILTSPPVKIVAEELGIPVLQPEDMNEEFLTPNTLRPTPDFLVVVAYGQILKDPLLKLPHIAPVNLHASLLPRWRGAAPIQNAILAGDSETGVTIQRIVRRLDAGPILSKSAIAISKEETTQELNDRLSILGADLLVETLKKPLKPQEQNEAQATLCKKLTRADSNVDCTSMTAEEIDRRVRALVPWPGVLCRRASEELKLVKTSLTPSDDSTMFECAGGTTLHILKLQVPGGVLMSGKAWELGRR